VEVSTARQTLLSAHHRSALFMAFILIVVVTCLAIFVPRDLRRFSLQTSAIHDRQFRVNIGPKL